MALPLRVRARVLPRGRGRHEPRGAGRRLLRSRTPARPPWSRRAGWRKPRPSGRRGPSSRATAPSERTNLFKAFQEFRPPNRVSLLSFEEQRPYEAFLYPFFVQQENGGSRTPFLEMWKGSASARKPEDLDALLDTLLPFEEHFRDFTVRNFNSTVELPASERHYQSQDGPSPRTRSPTCSSRRIDLELPASEALRSGEPAAAHSAVPALQRGRRRALRADRQRRARERRLRRPRRPRERARELGAPQGPGRRARVLPRGRGGRRPGALPRRHEPRSTARAAGERRLQRSRRAPPAPAGGRGT